MNPRSSITKAGKDIHVNSKRLALDKKKSAMSTYYPSEVGEKKKLNVKTFDHSAVVAPQDSGMILHTQINAFDERSQLEKYESNAKSHKLGNIFSE